MSNNLIFTSALPQSAPASRSVILVSMDWRRLQDGKTSLGTASIAAALKTAGVPFTLVEETINPRDFDPDSVFDLERMFERVVLALREAGPDCLIGFGTFVWNDAEVCELTKRLRAVTDAHIVLGGPQISYMPAGGLEQAYPYADYFVRGQGERAMVQLATGADLADFGVHFAGRHDTGKKGDHDLQSLPSPYLTGTIPLKENIRWETQRGCPFKCTFCQHRESGERLKNQFLGHGRLEAELALFARSGVKRISVLDPIFHTDNQRAIDLLNMMKQAGLSAQLSLQCRFEMVTDAFLDALEGLNVTLEFGLQTVNATEERIVARRNNLPKVEEAISKLKARGIDYEVSLIYGLPEQTLQSFQDTISWCKAQQIPRIQAWPLMLLRGTRLYDQKDQHGLRESVGEAIPFVIASNSFTEADYEAMALIAEAL